MHQRNAVICACIVAAYRAVGTEELLRMFDRREQQGAEAVGDREVRGRRAGRRASDHMYDTLRVPRQWTQTARDWTINNNYLP